MGLVGEDERESAGSHGHEGQSVDPEALHRRYERRIFAFGIRHLRNRQDAADLVQRVLVVVIEALRRGSVREPERLDAFVLGTARRVVLDQRATASRRERILHRHGAEAGAEVPNELAPLETARLYDCLMAIASRDRRVLVMTFYDERDSDEIATAMGLSVANVRVIRHRSLAQLRDCMAKKRGGTT